MNWKASATDWTKSSSRIVVMAFFQAKPSDRGTRGGDLRSDFPTQDLTIAGARGIPREVHDHGRREGGEPTAPEGEDLFGRDPASRLRNHVGDPEALVGARLFGDARAIGDRGMAPQHTLDLIGRDAIAEALDDVVLAPEAPQVARAVVARVVPGEEPAGALQLRALLGKVPVAQE